MAGLKERLRTLRRQVGGGGEQQTGGGSDLARRLQRIRPGRLDVPRIDDEAVAGLLDGTVVSAGLVVVERTLAFDHMHGAFALSALAEGVDHPDDGRPLDARGLLFIDTETTGLSGGTGTLAFLIGMGRMEGGAFRIRQYLLTAFSAEAAMLEAAADWIQSAHSLVSFNGKSFDLPLLVARYRLQGCRNPLLQCSHIDLLHPVRRAFATRWPDCRLQTAERRLLGFERRDDLPGCEAPRAWFDFLRFGSAARLPGVVRHNHWDLVSLAALLPAYARAFDEQSDLRADVSTVAAAWIRQGNESGAYDLLWRHRAHLPAQGQMLLARLLRRRGEWTDAVAIWRDWVERGSEEALEQLAKYYEHVKRDLSAAWELAQRLPCSPQHEQRRQRIRRKLHR